MELFLTRYLLGQVELPTDLIGRIKQGDRMPALGSHRGVGQPGRACAHYRNILGLRRRTPLDHGLVTGARVHEARRRLHREGVIQTRLIAGDTGIDLVLATLRRLFHQLGVGQHGSRHGYQIGVAIDQYGLGDIGHIDAVRGDDRNRHFVAHPLGHTGKRTTRHHSGNGRHLRLVPGEMGGDDRRAGRFDRLGEQRDLIPAHAALEHVHGCDAEDHNAIRTHRLAHPTHHLDREAHAVLVAATPLIGPLVGLFYQKRRQQVARRADDFDAVIPRLLSELGAVGVVSNLFFNTGLIQLIRRERTNARAHRRGRDSRFVISERPHVQNLQADLAVRCGRVNGIGDDAVAGSLFFSIQLGRSGQRLAVLTFDDQTTLFIGRDTAGNDHANATGGAFSIKGCHALEAVGLLLEASVHRAHDAAVAELRMPKVQR